MAASDRIAFRNTNVTFTPTGGNSTVIYVNSLSLNEQVTEADATTTEDNGYAYTVQTLAKISGTIKTFHREGQDLPLKARQTGTLVWNVNTTNPALGNYTVPVQIGSVNRGDADVSGVVPCTISFSGRGGWSTGSFGV